MSALSLLAPSSVGPWPAADRDSPFLMAPWLHNWQDLYVADSDRLVAAAGTVLPLVLRRRWLRGMVPVRLLCLVGTGDSEADELVPEFMDLGAVPGCASEHAVLAALRALPMDLCRLDNCLAGSHAEQLARLAGGLRQPAGWRYTVPLDGGLSHWMAGMQPAFRSKVNRLLRRVETENMQLLIAADVDQRLALFPELVRLHQQRWQRRQQPGVFASQRFTAFHQALLADPDMPARLAVLYRRGQPVAAWYGFDHSGMRYFYQGGVDQQQKGFSPGIALHALMIADAIERGMQGYDFMKGGEQSWKAQFNCQRSAVFHYLFFGDSIRARLLQSLFRRRGGWQSVEAR